MNSVKILHCADFHLDAPLVNLDKDIGDIRREELIESFGNIIDRAKIENVDIVLISGDLFDSARVSNNTINYIKKKIEEIKEIPVILSAGNHDSLLKNYYYRQTQWPSNFHVFDKSMDKIDYAEKNVCIYGRSFYNSYEEEGYLKGFKVEDEGKINIMILHGDMAKNSKYNPIMIEEIENSGLDYLALGHIHKFSGINKVKSTYWAYPGTPEGRGFDETGEKGIILGEVSKNYTKLEFVKTCKRQYIEMNIDITDMTTYDDIVNKIRERLGNESQYNMYKLNLKGLISENFNLNTEVIKNKLENEIYSIKIRNDRMFNINMELEENTLKQVFINNIKKMMDESAENEKDILKRALMLGLYAMKGEEIDFNEDT